LIWDLGFMIWDLGVQSKNRNLPVRQLADVRFISLHPKKNNNYYDIKNKTK
jgi:hypothetical protein